MAIELSNLILEVRTILSDIDIQYDADEIVYNDIIRADKFVEMIVIPNVEESYLKEAIVAVAAYYNYVTYTSLAERQLGELPPTSLVRIRALRSIARNFLLPISEYPLDEELNIDTKTLNKQAACGFGLTKTIIPDR